MVPGIHLRRHKASFCIRNVIGQHAEEALLIVRIDNDPFNNSKSSNRNRSLDSAHVAEVTRHWWGDEVTELMRYGDGAASIEADSEQVRGVSNFLAGENPNIMRCTGLKTPRGQGGMPKGSNRAAYVSNIKDTILIPLHFVFGG